MELHRNAALSWNGRRLLAERVGQRGMVARGGSGGLECERALRTQVGESVSARGQAWTLRSFLGAEAGR